MGHYHSSRKSRKETSLSGALWGFPGPGMVGPWQETLPPTYQTSRDTARDSQIPRAFRHGEASILAVGDADLGFQLHWGGQVTLAPASWQKEADQTPHPLLRVKKQSSMCIGIKGLNQSQCCLDPAWGQGGVEGRAGTGIS